MKWLKVISKLMLAGLMSFAGIMHFVTPAFFIKIVPPYIPFPRELVALSGVFEILLGALLLSILYTNSGLGHHSPSDCCLSGEHLSVPKQEIVPASQMAHFARLLLQGLLILWAYWHTKLDERQT